MNPEFEDFIDELQFKPLYVSAEVDVEAICGYSEEGELLCQTFTPADAENSKDLHSSSDGQEDVNEESLFLESLFTPLYKAVSMLNSYTPCGYMFNQTAGEEVAPAVELGDVDIIEDGEFTVVDLGDLVNFGDIETSAGPNYNVLDFEVFVEFDENEAELDPLLYFDVSNEDIIVIDTDIIQLDEEFVGVPETIEWYDQVFGALSFVLIALILTRIVLLCRRSRFRRTDDRKTPLLTVTVEKQNTNEGEEIGSYVPPQQTAVEKEGVVEKFEREPYLVFI